MSLDRDIARPFRIIRFSHVALKVRVSQDLQSVFRACAHEGELCAGSGVRRGPWRHGPANSAFVYFHDPYGHRIELILLTRMIWDAERLPVDGSIANKRRTPSSTAAPQRRLSKAAPVSEVPRSADGDLARRVAR